MVNSKENPAWTASNQSGNKVVSNTAVLPAGQNLSSAQPFAKNSRVTTTRLNTVLTVAFLATVLAASYFNDQLFFNELATVAAIALMVLVMKTKSN